MKNFTIIFILAVLFTACNLDKHSAGALEEEDFEPKSFSFFTKNKQDGKHVDIYGSMGQTIETGKAHSMELTAEPKYSKAGKEALKALDELKQAAAPEVRFSYNYGIENTLKVSGLKMSYIYDGQTYDLYCADRLEVRGDHKVTNTEEAPFKEESETVYNLYAMKDGKEILIATATQEFAIIENYVAPVFTGSQLIKSWHKNYQREAQLVNGELIVRGVNGVEFEDSYSNSEPVRVDSTYNLVHHFSVTYSSEMVFDKLDDVIRKTFTGNNGKFTVAGHEFVFTYREKECEVGRVAHMGTDYTEQVKRCRPRAVTLTILSSTQAKVRLYEDAEDDYAEAILPINLKEKGRFVGITDSFDHLSFRSQAVANGNVLSVICDNLHTATANYSDKTTKQAASKKYTYTNRFKVEVPVMEMSAEKKAALYGRTINLVDSQATVQGYVVKVVFKDRKVSEIKYNFEDKAYDVTSKAPVCKATAKAIRFNADGTMTVIFDGEGETVEGKVPVTINETVEVTELEGTIVAGYMTDSYWEHVSNREGTYQHIITILANGTYKHYSRKEGETSFAVADLTAQQGQALIAQNRAFAWYRSGNSYVLGTVEAWLREGYTDRYLLAYYDMNGNVAHYLGKAEETIGNPFRYPVISTLTQTAQGWTFGDGKFFK